MSTKEVEEMKEFMTILTEVKVSLAEQSVKLDNLLDMNNKLNRTYDVAMSALSKAEENEKDIAEIKKQMAEKASKKKMLGKSLSKEKAHSKIFRHGLHLQYPWRFLF